MAPLPAELRRDLERAVVDARGAAEGGAQAALVVLGVAAEPAPAGISTTDRALRVALRARAKALGAGVLQTGIDGLIEEVAYEQWHRMLFARFLAENGLLLHPGGAPVSMAEVAALAAEGTERDPWVLAANYGAAMLPGIFRTADPAHQIRFAPEHRARLEAILAALPAEVFTANDALGWVYQFWQAKRKDEVNKSGRKIGGADLPPVTQLFTEHYMVRFLLENSLGAWWAARHPQSPLVARWEYLRFRDDGSPAAGAFAGWPDRAAAITVMDPCCGSGHFLVAAAEMLRAMRMEEEGLSAAAAARAVNEDNLFGLELDPRCTQLAAFAVAFDAWKAGGYQSLPVPNIACSGIAVKGQLRDWQRLAGSDQRMADALTRLYELFKDAPELGSLIDPTAAIGDGLWAAEPDALLAKLEQALKKETDDPAAAVFGAAAEGTAKAARLLAGKYWLVATNPPYLTFRRFSDVLRQYVEAQLAQAKHELATAFFWRWLLQTSGATAFVLPRSWLYLGAYVRLREEVLVHRVINVIASLGTGAFSSISGEVVNVALFVVSAELPKEANSLLGIEAATAPTVADKITTLLRGHARWVSQLAQLKNPDSRIAMEPPGVGKLLEAYAFAPRGVVSGDTDFWIRKFWELPAMSTTWRRLQSSPESSGLYAGRSAIIDWRTEGEGMIRPGRDNRAYGRPGVAVREIGDLPATLYSGDLYDNNVAAIVPIHPSHLPALWAFCSSSTFHAEVRRIDKKMNVTNATLVKVPFDLAHWQQVAAEQYPNGLPQPYSDDPTQWLFKGTVSGSTAPLQVAVARLLGYRWPDQVPDALDALADADGIVTLPAVGGEAPAADRLRTLLAAAYGADWSPALADQLLRDAGSPGATLETWLRDDFFAQHARLFHNRPFIWQIWDGRKDGFAALLNYHRLDRQTLEKLAYSQLNDWIERQRASSDIGAEARLVAATKLQQQLKQILEGEPPYDIYVRWKPLERQPIGWDPDLDDGVRLNIRPFVTAGILRAKFTINWHKDRGTDPDGRERLNDVHHTRAEKQQAREKP